MSKPRKKERPPKRVLALPDLDQSKAAILNALTSKSGRRTYSPNNLPEAMFISQAPSRLEARSVQKRLITAGRRSP
jgi:site-specific recombinase XerC